MIAASSLVNHCQEIGARLDFHGGLNRYKAKRVDKFKMATLGYCSGKNTASTELLNRVVKMTLWREWLKWVLCFDVVKIVL
jgi:hypothetical protein